MVAINEAEFPDIADTCGNTATITDSVVGPAKMR
jgi:hypothetical protein